MGVDGIGKGRRPQEDDELASQDAPVASGDRGKVRPGIANVVARSDGDPRSVGDVRAAPVLDANRPPRPDVKPVPAEQARATAQLSAASRAELLAGLAVELEDARGVGDEARAERTVRALRRVLEDTDRVSLEQTLSACGTRRSLGYVMEALGLEEMLALGRARGLNVNDVLAQSDTVKRRGLTSDEARDIARNFGGTLDPQSLRFHFTTGAQTMGAYALVTGNTINIDPTTQRLRLRPGTTLPQDPDDPEYRETLLAHEPTHVWSYQHQGSRYAVNSATEQLAAISSGTGRNGAYGYTLGRASFFDYGEEQRAMMVEDYVAAERAIARGDAVLYFGGAGHPVDPAVQKKALEPYIQQMRAVGPGQAEAAVAEPYVCTGSARGFRQDGGMGLVGAQADALVGAAGRESLEALGSNDPARVLLGAAGVAGVVAASLAPREQNAIEGARGGGSALLDQAGIPRGVEVEGDRARAAVRVGYEAGLQNARVELSGSAEEQLGRAQVRMDGEVHVGMEGIQRVEGHVAVDAPLAEVDVRGGISNGAASQRIHGEVKVASGEVSGSARAAVERTQEDGLRSGHVEARVDVQRTSVSGAADLGKGGRLERAAIAAATRIANANVGVEAAGTPKGVDRAALSVGGQTAAGTVSAQAFVEDLQGSPDVGAKVALSREDVSVAVSAQRDLKSGETKGQVLVTVPLERKK